MVLYNTKAILFYFKKKNIAILTNDKGDRTLKTIGLIGGMSWESTNLYYQQLNRGVQHKRGGWSSAKVLLHSVNFQDILNLQEKNDWQGVGEILAHHAEQLQNSGAEGIVLCTNTMHKLAPMIEQKITIPFLHIIDALALQLKVQGITKVGVLGTAFTMQEPFYQQRLATHGIQMVVPSQNDQQVVHDIIYNELCKGIVTESSKQRYIEIVNNLIQQEAQGIVLGCTEIVLLIGQEKFIVPTFDTTAIHIQSALNFML